MPRGNEGPGCHEGGHVFEVLPDVLRRLLQYFRIHRLSVIHISTDAVVHVCPERGDEGPAVAQRKSLRRELADLHVEGDHAIVVHLGTEAGFQNCLDPPYGKLTNFWNGCLQRWYGTGC